MSPAPAEIAYSSTRWYGREPFTCIVTFLSSTSISLVRKSAPIVALYSLVNFF